MNIEKDLFFRTGESASTADEILYLAAEQVSDLLPNFGTEAIYRKLQRRENVTSTSIGHGVALPHCFLDGLDHFVAGLVTTRKPVEFDAPDGVPVDLFFFIVAPTGQRSEHVALLSRISRFVRPEESRMRLREAANESILKTLVSPIFHRDSAPEEIEWCELQVFLPVHFGVEAVLEELTSRTTGNVFVHEFKKASRYLTRMPLFASLWTSDVDESIRLVTALLDKRLVNETIRSMKNVLAEQDATDDVLITARDVFYVSGHVEL